MKNSDKDTVIKFVKENIENFEILNPQKTKMEDYKNIQLENTEDIRSAFIDMIKNVREIKIISSYFSSWFFHDENIKNIFKDFLLSNLRNKIFVLVKNDKSAAEGSLFLSLSKRLPSQFKIKVIKSKLESSLNENMILFDKKHYIRFYEDTFIKGDGSFNNETYGYKMHDEFENAFNYSGISLELRDILL